jgi:hypothetical protein
MAQDPDATIYPPATTAMPVLVATGHLMLPIPATWNAPSYYDANDEFNTELGAPDLFAPI